MPIRAPGGRIAFATIEALTLGANAAPGQALKRALVPGTRVEVRGRTWRMGKWKEEGNALVGRIGFQSSGTAELWDEEIKDFSEETRPLGLTSPFAIDPESLRVAFQLRGREIRAKSFTGALQALLNAASPSDRWRVARDVRTVPLDEWADDMDRVTDVRLSLQRPNPHYEDRDKVEAIVEGTNAALIEIAAHADREDPQGIDLNDSLIRQAIEHAKHNYGHVTAFGESNGEKSQWSSEDDAVADIRTATTDPVSHEVSTSALRRELGDATAVAKETEDARAAVEDYKAGVEDAESDGFDMLDEDEEQP
jgi:hypothetical protein